MFPGISAAGVFGEEPPVCAPAQRAKHQNDDAQQDDNFLARDFFCFRPALLQAMPQLPLSLVAILFPDINLKTQRATGRETP